MKRVYELYKSCLLDLTIPISEIHGKRIQPSAIAVLTAATVISYTVCMSKSTEIAIHFRMLQAAITILFCRYAEWLR